MILEYTLPKFDENDEMFFDEDEETDVEDSITLPLFDDNDDIYGVSVTYTG